MILWDLTAAEPGRTENLGQHRMTGNYPLFCIQTVHPHIERQSGNKFKKLKRPLVGLEKPFSSNKQQRLSLSPICFMQNKGKLILKKETLKKIKK